MALESYGGQPTHFGFGMLAVLWLFTSAMAYVRIRQRNIQSHREWMIRSFALTFAAVMLRIWLPLFVGVWKIDFVQAFDTISWLCWVPNMLVAEVLVNQSRRRLAALNWAGRNRGETLIKSDFLKGTALRDCVATPGRRYAARSNFPLYLGPEPPNPRKTGAAGDPGQPPQLATKAVRLGDPGHAPG